MGSNIPVQCMAYIHNRTPSGTTMDAPQYDRVADLLMQIRKKYDALVPITDKGKKEREIALDLVEALLITNDELGKMTVKGWL